MQSFVPPDAFVLKIQRELCHPKSFGTSEKRAPGLLLILKTRLGIYGKHEIKY